MLGIGSGSFDPETLVVLEAAFDEAWITLKTNGSGNIKPNELARRICHLAMEGEREARIELTTAASSGMEKRRAARGQGLLGARGVFVPAGAGYARRSVQK